MGTIQLLRDARSARDWCAETRAAGHSLGLVPTMGALHAGHASLVEAATRENDRVVVSVFVNPLQFDDPSDLEKYPRDFEGDAELLAEAGADMVFTDDLQGFFAEVPGATVDSIPRVDPGPAAAGLEGAHRNGHFEGVATIVARLFELTEPTRAYFGEKDYQQTLVVEHVARGLGFPEIRVVETSREADGLARSSRNTLLDAAGRERAISLSRALFAARELFRSGERHPLNLRAELLRHLEGVEVDYAEVRDPEAWSAERPVHLQGRARALVAARVGAVRLIDNLALDDLGKC